MAAESNLTLQQVRESNARIDASTYPRTAVFVGGTAGIGQAAIAELVHVSARNNIKIPSRIYIIGREQSAERTKKALDILRAENPNAELVWMAGDVSLLADVKRLCEEIKDRETSLDLLFLSTGYSPFGGREETTEGLVVTQALGHYSRMLFIHRLLPLLQANRQGCREGPKGGKVVSLLGAGREFASISTTDIQLRNPGAWSGYRIQGHTGTQHTICLERMAEANPSVSFIHAGPGLVNTGNLNRGWGNHWILQGLANVALAPFFAFLAMNLGEAGERMVFLMTSGRFAPITSTGASVQGEDLDGPSGMGGVELEGVKKGITTRRKEGGGLYLVGWKGRCWLNEHVLTQLRDEKGDAIWKETMEVLGPHL
ncbi:NAD(P)-binding protein [Rhypophila decipiens]|uniref:NAD(P)-binding protein n=1 Tax=Rhypophila decipiens TaxID=261697 RepID=A0AAN6XXY1_9PEZI|nr:NAD(P)-binding protein [Rhypophila decipiens]